MVQKDEKEIKFPIVYTFGCRMNMFESNCIRSMMVELEMYDFIVVNSCSVTAESERQCRQEIRKLHRENPNFHMLITGCSAQLRSDFFQKMPEIDFVICNELKLKRHSYELIKLYYSRCEKVFKNHTLNHAHTQYAQNIANETNLSNCNRTSLLKKRKNKNIKGNYNNNCDNNNDAKNDLSEIKTTDAEMNNCSINDNSLEKSDLLSNSNKHHYDDLLLKLKTLKDKVQQQLLMQDVNYDNNVSNNDTILHGAINCNCSAINYDIDAIDCSINYFNGISDDRIDDDVEGSKCNKKKYDKQNNDIKSDECDKRYDEQDNRIENYKHSKRHDEQNDDIENKNDINESNKYDKKCDYKQNEDNEWEFIQKFEDRSRAFVPIQTGCDHFCAFCIVPFTRGRFRSFDPEHIIKQIQIFVKNNYKEVVLTGIDITDYGKDFRKLMQQQRRVEQNNINQLEEYKKEQHGCDKGKDYKNGCLTNVNNQNFDKNDDDNKNFSVIGANQNNNVNDDKNHLISSLSDRERIGEENNENKSDGKIYSINTNQDCGKRTADNKNYYQMNDDLIDRKKVDEENENERKNIYQINTLGKLCKAILQQTTIERLRLSSVDVAEIDEDIMDLVANEKRFMPYFHISAQSGSDAILKKMRRRHTRKDVLNFCHKVLKLRPDACFGADIIAGFPSETEKDFELSMDMVKKAPISFVHAFPYSKREKTLASLMNDDVPKKAKKERVKQLIELGKKNLQKMYKKMDMTQQKLLVERNGIARAENFIAVKINNFDINNSDKAKDDLGSSKTEEKKYCYDKKNSDVTINKSSKKKLKSIEKAGACDGRKFLTEKNIKYGNIITTQVFYVKNSLICNNENDFEI